MIVLPKQVILALQLLENNGYEGFVVGGCVRDYLLGNKPHDIDITTNATPETVMQIFKDYKVIETGLKHGTVTIIIESMSLEITTYHIDGDYLDNRRPNSILYTQKIKDDLARRDFTMNAIAYNPKLGFVDPFNGKNDIENKIIKSVGIAEDRLNEDALRILRGIRFSSTLGFEIEQDTANAMYSCKSLLKNISVERVYVEFCKTLLGENVKKSFLSFLNIWAVVIPEILAIHNFVQNNPYHIYDVLTHTLVAVENTPIILHLRLAAFFHDIGKPNTYFIDDNGTGHFHGHNEKSVEITEGILNQLKVDNKTKDKVLTLIKYHDTPIENRNKTIKRWLRKLSPEVFFDLLELKKSDYIAQNPQYSYRQNELIKSQELAQNIILQQSCFNMKDLAVNGKDLILLGYSGKDIGTVLNKLLDKVINEKIENDKNILIKEIEK